MIYVDADKLERGIREFSDGNGEIIGMFLTDFHLLLEECAIKRRSIRPSDNLTEVVRCKDCIHLGVKDFAYGYCKDRMVGILSPNDYCSYGEKKE